MNPISLCSVSAPWLPLTELAPRLRAAGYDGVEVNFKAHRFDPAQPPNCWGNNAAILDADQGVAGAQALRRILLEHDLRVPCLGSYFRATDRSAFPLVAGVASALGAPLVRATIPDHDPAIGYAAQLADLRSAFRELEQWGRRQSLCFVIELHDHTCIPSASAAMRVLEGLDPAHVGAILDVANLIREGNESLPMAIDLLGPHLRHVHVKDARARILDQPRRLGRHDTEHVPLGEGQVPWQAILAHLVDHGYRGWFSLENFTQLDRGVDRIESDLRWLRVLLASGR